MQNVFFHVIAFYHKYMYNKDFIKMTTIEDLYSGDNKKKEQTTWTGADPGLFNRGFKISEGVWIDPVILFLEQKGLSKQYRPRSDTTERGVWSRSILFATYPATLDTFASLVKMIWLKF